MFGENTGIFGLIQHGGFTMVPLVICSVIATAVTVERLIQYQRLGTHLRSFHLEAMNALLRNEMGELRKLCDRNKDLPTSQLIQTALERLEARDERLRDGWMDAVERRRQLINQDVKKNLWVLGTIGSSAPFIGLAGTVVGVLQSFQEMAQKGAGGFNVVAGGISEALIATAAGIIVAIIAVIAYNAFQTRCAKLILLMRIQAEEFAELLKWRSEPVK